MKLSKIQLKKLIKESLTRDENGNLINPRNKISIEGNPLDDNQYANIRSRFESQEHRNSADELAIGLGYPKDQSFSMDSLRYDVATEGMKALDTYITTKTGMIPGHGYRSSSYAVNGTQGHYRWYKPNSKPFEVLQMVIHHSYYHTPKNYTGGPFEEQHVYVELNANPNSYTSDKSWHSLGKLPQEIIDANWNLKSGINNGGGNKWLAINLLEFLENQNLI